MAIVIPATEARSMFTKAVVSVYKENSNPTSFLKSFFPTVIKSTKYLSIEVERGFEKVAVDVHRGSDGNRNSFGKSTEKIIEPAYFNEYFDATQLSLYDRFFTDAGVSDETMADFVEEVASKLLTLQGKIDRAYEVQSRDVLTGGKITLNDGSTIDYKRKTASIVAYGGNTWATGTNNPITDFKAGLEFLRTKGKTQGTVYNAILGDQAMEALLNNEIFQKRADLRNINLDMIRDPQKNSVGGSLHGRITAGSNLVNLWTYAEYYDNADGVSTPYIGAKDMILLPENPKFVFGYAAVPQLVTNGSSVVKGDYIFYDFQDQRKASHDFGIKSAGIPIPVAIDQVYKAQVLA